MKEGGIHITTEKFTGVNHFMVAKQGLWGFYASVRNLAFSKDGILAWCLVR